LNRSKLITPLGSIATSASGNQGTVLIVRTWARYNGWQWPRFAGHFRGVREFGRGFHYAILYHKREGCVKHFLKVLCRKGLGFAAGPEAVILAYFCAWHHLPASQGYRQTNRL